MAQFLLFRLCVFWGNRGPFLVLSFPFHVFLLSLAHLFQLNH